MPEFVRTNAQFDASIEVAVEIVHVGKQFGELQALDDVSLTLPAGSVTALIGPSGSGKSTLLRCINGLELADDGRVSVFGQAIGTQEGGKQLSERDAALQRSEIGMVFQSFNLFPHMTALENVMAGPAFVRRASSALARSSAEQLLDRVGLASKAKSYPRHLSGGQQQRVAIARALAMNPRVMLFDEPTSALDPETIHEVLQVIADVAGAGMTLIIATHEMGFAQRVADLVVFMDQGRIGEVGSPRQVFFHSTTERCRDFLSKILSDLPVVQGESDEPNERPDG